MGFGNYDHAALKGDYLVLHRGIMHRYRFDEAGETPKLPDTLVPFMPSVQDQKDKKKDADPGEVKAKKKTADAAGPVNDKKKKKSQ